MYLKSIWIKVGLIYSNRTVVKVSSSTGKFWKIRQIKKATLNDPKASRRPSRACNGYLQQKKLIIMGRLPTRAMTRNPHCPRVLVSLNLVPHSPRCNFIKTWIIQLFHNRRIYYAQLLFRLGSARLLMVIRTQFVVGLKWWLRYVTKGLHL